MELICSISSFLLILSICVFLLSVAYNITRFDV